MTGTRRPTGIPPPSPNHENNSDEGEDSEEGEDLNEEGSDGGGSASSGATTPLTREIRSYEERNRELAGRLREVEEERLHQIEIQEGWRNALIVLESKLREMELLCWEETSVSLLKILKRLVVLKEKSSTSECLSVPTKDMKRNQINDRKLMMVKGQTWRRLIKRMTPKQMQIN